MKPVGLTMNLETRVEAHAKGFLSRAKAVRVALQSAAIASPALIACAKGVETYAGSAEVKAAAITSQYFLLLVAAFCSLLVLLTDKPASGVLEDAYDALREKKAAEGRAEDARRLNEQLRAELVKTERLGETVEAMRRSVDFAISTRSAAPDHIEMSGLLDLLVASKDALFSMGDEQWNFSIYLWCDTEKELKAVASRRPGRGDEEKSHRSWGPGEGHVGKAFLDRRTIVSEDTQLAAVKAFFEAPQGKQGSGDDSARYRSVAAVPFGFDAENPASMPKGVVVATSDIPGRFEPSDGITDSEAVKPIRALSNTLATLLAVNHLCSERGSV